MLSFCSPFYHDFAYFGGYPTKDHFQQLIENDFTYFIDLTTLRERQRLEYDYSLDIPHHKNLFYINFSDFTTKLTQFCRQSPGAIFKIKNDRYYSPTPISFFRIYHFS